MAKKYSIKWYCMLFTLLSISTGSMRGASSSGQFLSAAEMGRLDIVEQIVAQHPNVIHVQDNEGNTALHYAIKREGFLHVVKFLVSCGIDINKPNKGGTTPLFAAAFYGWYFIVDFLIQQAADYNRANGTNKSPLFWAALNRKRPVTSRLVNACAYIDQEAENQIIKHFPRYDFRKERRVYRVGRIHAFIKAVRPTYLPNELTKHIFEFEEGTVSSRSHSVVSINS